jgi:ketosteroid isomerase-like protein
MTSDESQIRGLIESWAAAVHTGDLDRVLADVSVPAVRESQRRRTSR